MRKSVILIGAVFACIAPAAALADTQSEAVGLCNAEMKNAEAERFQGMRYSFRSIRGGRVKKVRYRLIWEGKRASVVCRVQGGKIEALAWPEAFLEHKSVAVPASS